MVIEASRVGGMTVLALTGDLDAGSSAEVRAMVNGLLAGDSGDLLVDLSGVQRVYTAGVGVLIDLQKALSVRGGRLVCCGARPFIRELLRITVVDRSLDLLPDLETALECHFQAS